MAHSMTHIKCINKLMASFMHYCDIFLKLNQVVMAISMLWSTFY